MSNKFGMSFNHMKRLPPWRMAALAAVVLITGIGLLLRAMYRVGGAHPYGSLWAALGVLSVILVYAVIYGFRQRGE